MTLKCLDLKEHHLDFNVQPGSAEFAEFDATKYAEFMELNVHIALFEASILWGKTGTRGEI